MIDKKIVSILEKDAFFSELIQSNAYRIKSFIKLNAKDAFGLYKLRYEIALSMQIEANKEELTDYKELLWHLSILPDERDIYIVYISSKDKVYLVFIDLVGEEVVGKLIGVKG